MGRVGKVVTLLMSLLLLAGMAGAACSNPHNFTLASGNLTSGFVVPAITGCQIVVTYVRFDGSVTQTVSAGSNATMEEFLYVGDGGCTTSSPIIWQAMLGMYLWTGSTSVLETGGQISDHAESGAAYEGYATVGNEVCAFRQHNTQNNATAPPVIVTLSGKYQ